MYGRIHATNGELERNLSYVVIPAQAGIQWSWRQVFATLMMGLGENRTILLLDSGLRRNDEQRTSVRAF
ncbi:hypothetical protein [Dyella amyloliquefaciens]|uniref:hypothetical protein n=1 Tax=Dyella amyloliquefaciens TaxID=1770545 RepID=UPI00102EC66A|nr:hypothetical protein [Dyella amyloliquefaciens]